MWPFKRKRMVKDPVCGMDVEEDKAAATSIHGGSTYYFCSQACKEEFNREPMKYMAPTRPTEHGGMGHGH